jgi:multisubunit Na+/H+ antiporter MnhF subunit
MNVWLWGATALLAGFVPLGFVALRAGIMDALVAVEVSGTVVTVVFVLLAEGFQRPPFFDLAIVAALLSLGGSLTFARFLERGL